MIQSIKRLTLKYLPLTALLVSLGLSFFFWCLTERYLEQLARVRFEQEAERIQFLIKERIGVYLEALHGAQGLFAASKQVDRDEWKAYLEGYDIRQRYPGIVAVEFVERVKAEEKESFIERTRLDTSLSPAGYPDFKIFPESHGKELFVVNYIEPLQGNTSAFGFDVGSEKVRLAALERAQDTDAPVLTPSVRLIQDASNHKGLLIFVPVYRNGLPHSNVEERRKALTGFVLGVFRASDLFSNIFSSGAIHADMGVQIFDDMGTAEAIDPLYSHRTEGLQPVLIRKKLLQSKIPLQIAGRLWGLHFRAQHDFGIDPIQKRFPMLVLLGGTGLSFLLFGVLFLLSSANQQAAVLAQKMTEDLRHTEARYRLVAKASNDVIWDWDLVRDKVEWNEGVTTLFGFPPGEVGTNAAWWSGRVHAEDRQRVLDSLDAAFKAREVNWREDYRFLCHKGRMVQVIDRGYVLFDPEGKPVRMIGSMMDITSQKAAEEELRARAEELERVNKIMVNRETKMIELKERIRFLEDRLKGAELRG